MRPNAKRTWGIYETTMPKHKFAVRKAVGQSCSCGKFSVIFLLFRKIRTDGNARHRCVKDVLAVEVQKSQSQIRASAK